MGKHNASGEKDYKGEYSEKSFWEKIKKYAIKAGSEVIEKALILYYCFKDKDTPLWAKGVILGALGYFICPIDAIPDITPVVGYADDLGALIGATFTVGANIKKQHRKAAKEKVEDIFGVI